ncbi:ribonuclease P protein component [Mesomycoplasma moatsii]|uniref:ribonuclease P protein component n=1 Tax=Mesomycoplasma moatsii TaxID=171287 RepID=UPI0003B2E77A
MKKENILKKNLEFQKVINTKKQLINKYLIFYYESCDQFKIGISTPKRFANAVKRNFIKRQIKWIFDSFINYQDIKNKIVLIVRKDFINLSIEEKKKQIIKMFNKLRQG